MLATRHGFTDEELDFIPSAQLRAGINYDIKCQTGRAQRKVINKELRILATVWCRLFLMGNPKGGLAMAKNVENLAEEIRDLADIDKLRLLDTILTDLDKPDAEIDRVWAEEARKRWTAYKAGKVPTVSYESVMAKHRRS